MSIERSYISTNLFGHGKGKPVSGDSLATGRGYYYSSQNNDAPKDNEFAKKGISITFGQPTEEDEDLGGCFEFNDIFKVYPVVIRSSALKYKNALGQDLIKPVTQENKSLNVWRFSLFGGDVEGQQNDPLVEVETPYGTQLIPFSSDGMIPKKLFSTRYYDHSFKQVLPARPEIALENQDLLGNSSPAKDLSSFYSFHVPEYEEYTDSNIENYQETSFPYIYNFIDEIHNSDLNNLFSSLEQAKTFFWDDPKCNMFLGGSNTPSTRTSTVTGDQYANNTPSSINAQFVNYAPSIHEPFSDIAQFERRMHGNALDADLDTLYEGQYKKEKDSALKQYFLKWTVESTFPSDPIVVDEVKPAPTPYTTEITKNVRKLLEHKYKNIFFRQPELMDYNNTQNLFPMSSRIKIENIPNINSGFGWQKSYTCVDTIKKTLKKYTLFENIFDKFAETTSQPYFRPVVLGEQQNSFYALEKLYPRTLNQENEYYDSITNYTPLDYDKASNQSILELPFNAKVIDFKEFVKEFKDPNGDFVYDVPGSALDPTDPNYSPEEGAGYNIHLEFTKSQRYASVGINRELGEGDEFVEGKITDPIDFEKPSEHVDPNLPQPSKPLMADYFSQDIYNFVNYIFKDTITMKYDFNNGAPIITSDDPHAQFKSYNEILGLRISKHEIDASGNPVENPIQNVYFPNNSKFQFIEGSFKNSFPSWTIDYLDTHVKYGKRYFYKAHLITAVIGKKYFYRNLTSPKIVEDGNESYFESTMEMVVEPSVIIAEVPYGNLGRTSVTSPPPLPPRPEFIPSTEIPGSVKILLKNDNNSGFRKPIPIEESDKDYYAKVLESQSPKGEDVGKIYFTSDDPVAGYRIYRLDEKPTAIGDFANAYTLLSTDLDATHYNEVMSLNQKYYYLFRTVDVHGGISNPSNIYEIELVSLTDGSTDVAIYPVIKVHSINEFFVGESYPNKRTFRRYIHIKPSRNQSQISNLEKLLSQDAHKLNLEDPDTGELTQKFTDEWNKYSENYSVKKNEFPTFGSSAPESRFIIGSKISDGVSTLKNRKIKIRLTSKSTGRKIDLNLNFKHTHFPYDPSHQGKNENVPDQDDN